MLAKPAVLIALLLNAASAFALPTHAIPAPTIPTSEGHRILSARSALEDRIGIKLDARQTADFELLSNDEFNPGLIQVSNPSPKKSIYCVGVAFNAVYARLSGGCVHIWSGKTYALEMLGVGYGLQAVGSVFRLTVKFDPTRYDEKFDPVPGRYGMGTQGGALGGGITSYGGDAGNKTISGGGVNVGLGIDLGSISFLMIE